MTPNSITNYSSGGHMQNDLRSSFILIVIMLSVFAGCSPINGKKYKIPFPVTQNISHNTFVCEALIDGDFTGSADKHLTSGIEATVGKGINKASLQIKDQQTLLFLSGASLNTGGEGGVDFSIIKNDDNELIATMWNDSSLNSIVVNKINGLAIWSKIRSDFPGYHAPVANLSYLICR